MDCVKKYYNEHAQEYAKKTAEVFDLKALDSFMSGLPKGAKILDVGTGSGRDALYFKDRGFNVEAIDVSSELCEIASRTLNQPVCNKSVLDIEGEGVYDGVWCYASLLHLSREDIQKSIDLMFNALTKGGCLFMSFKHGETDGVTHCGRFYFDMNHERLKKFKMDKWQTMQVWIEPCKRQGGNRPDWFCILLKK
ncbi:MAG: class I SAM-dependent methyltransferase [Pseudomonadota bacterium]|nr:class I SAM-dependent methyltransferase [Pseudomonadota bacterium]